MHKRAHEKTIEPNRVAIATPSVAASIGAELATFVSSHANGSTTTNGSSTVPTPADIMDMDDLHGNSFDAQELKRYKAEIFSPTASPPPPSTPQLAITTLLNDTMELIAPDTTHSTSAAVFITTPSAPCSSTSSTLALHPPALVSALRTANEEHKVEVDLAAVEAEHKRKRAEASGSDWHYYDQLILAPMVRVGMLPMRTLAHNCGATMMYTDEIIDRKIIATVRSQNKELGTADFRNKNGEVVFQALPNERVVFQVGTADSVRALQAAQMVMNDVRAFDVNMGCPVHFSTQGGMGSALLSKPETIHDILTTLVRNLGHHIPITCKIRLLDSTAKTLDLVRMIESCGVRALGIHARHIADRPRYRALLEDIPILVQHLSIPVIHNGDVFYYDDIARTKARTGAASVMIARGALWNASVFSANSAADKQGMVPVYQVVRDYFSLAQQYNAQYLGTKYVVLEMLKLHVGKTPFAPRLSQAKSYQQLAEVLASMSAEPSINGPYKAPIHLVERPIVSSDSSFPSNKRVGRQTLRGTHTGSPSSNESPTITPRTPSTSSSSFCSVSSSNSCPAAFSCLPSPPDLNTNGNSSLSVLPPPPTSNGGTTSATATT